MTETTPFHRERDAVILIADGGPLVLDRNNAKATNAKGEAALATLHALERKLLVVREGTGFVLTSYGATTAASFTRKDS